MKRARCFWVSVGVTRGSGNVFAAATSVSRNWSRVRWVQEERSVILAPGAVAGSKVQKVRGAKSQPKLSVPSSLRFVINQRIDPSSDESTYITRASYFMGAAPFCSDFVTRGEISRSVSQR